jgi:hypothetical protein
MKRRAATLTVPRRRGNRVDAPSPTAHAFHMAKASAEDALSTDVVASHTYFHGRLRTDGIVWLRRTAIVYPSVDEVHRAYDEFLGLVDDWVLRRRIKSGNLGTKTRSQMAWLFDVRSAPSHRNDAEFERAVEDRRKDLLRRSPLLAILVQSASGRMQLTRMSRDGGAKLMIFDDFSAAVAALLAGMNQPSG